MPQDYIFQQEPQQAGTALVFFITKDALFGEGHANVKVISALLNMFVWSLMLFFPIMNRIHQ